MKDQLPFLESENDSQNRRDPCGCNYESNWDEEFASILGVKKMTPKMGVIFATFF